MQSSESRGKHIISESGFWQQESHSLARRDANFEEKQPHQGIPHHSLNDAQVATAEIEYNDRAADDFVISGPLADNKGPGRRFATRADANRWAQERYGARLKREVKCGPYRWAFLVRQSVVS